MVSVGFLGDEWINSGAVWKKTKKKSTGQMNLVFDEESMALPVREAEDREPEYPFLGMSITYRADGLLTACMFQSEELDAAFLLGIIQKLQKGIPQIALLDWKNAMHLVTPIEQLSPKRRLRARERFLMRQRGRQRNCFHRYLI